MKTKIIATIGPASRRKETLARLIAAGVRIFRLNFSHGDSSAFVDIIRDLRALECEHRVPLTLMQDLSGPKIRIGRLKGDQPISLDAGTELFLGASELEDSALTGMPYIPFDHEAVMSQIEKGDHLIIADGGMRLRVKERLSGKCFRVEAENAGIITSRKGLTLPGKSIPVSALTEKDRRDLADGLALGVDAVAVSYVQTPEDVRVAKEIIREHGRHIPVVAKLERRGAVERLPEILAEADIIMVARGDLGVECPLAELPAMQKRIVRACNAAAKPVIVATQMLVSMVSNPVPTRAETTDVANAVWDGADCVMMSEETAMGAYPVEAALAMREITTQAENVMEENHVLSGPRGRGAAEFLAYSVCVLAEKVNAKGIVAYAERGTSARLISALKPSCPVYVVTRDQQRLRALNFSWGLHPRQLGENAEVRHLARAEQFINASSHFKPGDFAVIAASSEQGSDTGLRTDTVKVYRK